MPRRRLITEREILRAVSEGTTTIEAGDAVVTPSARDVAKRSGVTLVGVRGAPPKSQSTPASRSPRHQSPAPAPPPPPAATPPTTAPSRPAIALGADHGGVALKDAIAARLRELGHPVTDLGTSGADAVDYPDFAVAVARAVAARQAQVGIMIDGAGIGSCMAANKVRGVRAAMCYDVTTATNAREHNNANLLTLGGGLIGTRLALAIVETFLSTPFAGGRHASRVAKIDALDGHG